VWRGLAQLVQAEVLYQQGVLPQATYTFKHALIQEAAYQTLLKSTRQQYHQRTAQVLMELFPETVETQPELLAHHYTEAGLAAPAVAYWQRAGERSHGRSAYAEVVAHCTRGLAVLQTLPDTTTRTEHELDLLLLLGEALAVSKGQAAPETGHVLTRARERCHQVGDTTRLLTVLGLLRQFYLNRVQLQAVRELDEECLLLAQRQPDPARLSTVYSGLGITLYFLGALVPARMHLEQAIALQTSVPMLAYAGLTLLLLGFPDQALTRIDEAQRWAQEQSHAFPLARALYYAAHFHQLRRDAAAAQQRAEASLALMTEQGFAHFVGPATQMRGWALAAQGLGQEGLGLMHQGLAAFRAMGAEIGKPIYHAMLAEAYGGMG
jgi:tetratricopeptide (TPR) repeat protein